MHLFLHVYCKINSLSSSLVCAKLSMLRSSVAFTAETDKHCVEKKNRGNELNVFQACLFSEVNS